MILVSGAKAWSFELPSDWQVAPSDWEPGFSARRGEATLHVMGWALTEPGGFSDHQRRQVVDINRSAGRSVVDVQCGTWSGHLIEVEDGALWCRCWLLVAGTTEVEGTYTCPLADAGADDAAINLLLCTLSVGGGAA